MTDALTLRSYAKINLTLDVFSKRADGYHSLASVMQTISLYDTLTLRRTAEPGVAFTCEAPESIPVPADATNLAAKAALATLEAAGRVDAGIALHLVKRIPAQAGLGGGSGNAAAAAVGVNALLELNLDAKALHAIAASLGSDAPFFLTGGTATARGRGETLTPLPDAPPYWLVVAKPEVGVSTAWAYNALDADPERASHRATKRWEEALKAGDVGRMIAFQSNDFEAVVFPHLPEISWLHDELRMAGALTAHLCGSGSAVYGVVESEAQARRIAQLLDGRYPHLHIARTLARAESNPLATHSP